jgi:subtilase family serine protease
MVLGGRNVPALPAKAISQGTAALKIPPTIPLGNYYLVACADDNKVLPETAEDDNCISSPIVYGAPDLTETLFSVSPSPVVRGHIVTIVDTVTNSGNAAAGASTTRYYRSTSTDIAGALRLGAKAVPALAAGAATSPKVPKALTIPANTTPGDYYLIFCADDLGMVPEADETNNCASTQVTVK